MSRIRSCHFMIVLYSDNERHQKVFYTLAQCGYQYCGIVHDSDTDESGVLKKEHSHVVVSFPRQKDLSALARELDVEENLIEPVRNKIASYRYLVHLDDPSQFQYDPSLIFGTLAESTVAIISSGSTEEEKVKSLLVLLDSMPKPCSYRRFLIACCDAHLYSTFRRLGHVLKELMDEHNGWGIIDS